MLAHRENATIAVIGTGYVGLTTAVCLAELGHRVAGVDTDAEKIATLRRGETPIYEPGLGALLRRTCDRGRLRFTIDYHAALREAEFVYIAVATPIGPRGEANVQFVKQAARSIAEAMQHPITIVNKSTVPIRTGDVISRIIREHQKTDIPFRVVFQPEFLREGSAIHDFMNPDRLVFGSHDADAVEHVAALYDRLDAPTLFTDLYTAEMIKYACNAFLATRISFINEIARICERVDADVKVVAQGMGLDRRIGPLFLDAGIGYGGSCLPKDLQALARMAETAGCHPELLHTVMEINRDQRKLVVEKLREVLGSLRGRTVGLLGLAFKPNTDDMRAAPSLDVIASLLRQGAHVRAYDPAAMPVARQQLDSSIQYCEDAYALADEADALMLVTEWDQFRALDFERIKRLMRRPVVIDGRNFYDPKRMRDLGFQYRGVGRS